MQVLPVKKQSQPVAIELPVKEQSAQMEVIGAAVSNFGTIKMVPCMTLLHVRVFLWCRLLFACKARGGGPADALKRLMANTCTGEEKSAWVKRARLDSLLGSCPKSHQSFHSGAKLWAAYADKVLGLRNREFPPPLGGLLAWAGLFRHPKTFSNYLGYVRLGCHVLDVSDAVFLRPELKRAKLAVKKIGAFKPRQRMFLCHEQIRRIVAMADTLL